MSLTSTQFLSWSLVIVIIWVQSFSGTNSTFPGYSSQLKQLLSLSQRHLNYFAFASDAGKLFCFISGLAACHFPGLDWLVLLIGSILGLIGYGLQYLAIKFHITFLLSFWSFLVLSFIAGHSICWMNTVCLVFIQKFQSNHQVAAGIITSYQGLSTKIYTDIVHVVSSAPGKRAQHYLLLDAILPMVVCVIFIANVVALKILLKKNKIVALNIDAVGLGGPRNVRVAFLLMFVITIFTGVYSVISSSLSSKILPWVNATVIGMFLLAPLTVIPIVEKVREKSNDDLGRMEKEVKEREDDKEAQVVVGEEIGWKLMLQRLNFWLYIVVYFLGPTIGLVFLNNLGQIFESRGYIGTALVPLSSSFGFFGRLLPSFIDYYIRHKISRPALVAVFMVPQAAAFILLLSSANISLFISTAIIGTCTGAISSIAISITAELFGSVNFPVNHNIMVANIPLGSLVFGQLASHVYHKEGVRNGDGKCMGMECYRSTFILWGSLCCLGFFVALVLYARTRKFYSQRSG